MTTRPLLKFGRWRSSVRDSLNAMLSTYGKHSRSYDSKLPPLATFDWDNTCTHGDIGEAVMEELDLMDDGSRVWDYENIYQAEGAAAAYTYCAYQLAGLNLDQIQELTQHTIETGLHEGRLKVRPEIQELIVTLQNSGWQVWIISASAQVIVQIFAKSYGIAAENVIGVRLKSDEQGVLLPQLDGPLTFRAGKVEAIKKYIDRKPLFAAGDTATDIEMLQSARYRLLIDAGNIDARKAAKAGGWWVQPPFEIDEE